MPNTLTKKFAILVVAVVGAGLLVAVTAAKLETTYTDLFNPLGVPNPLVPTQIGQFLTVGNIMCPGHTYTGDPAQPCPEGSRLTARGLWALSRLDSNDPAMAGWMTVELNANLAPDYAGPTWGKLSVQLDAGGMWEGTWQGTRERVPNEPPIWIVDLRMELHGTGGEIDGMQAKCTEQIMALTAMPVLYKGLGSCRMIKPGEK